MASNLSEATATRKQAALRLCLVSLLAIPALLLWLMLWPGLTFNWRWPSSGPARLAAVRKAPPRPHSPPQEHGCLFGVFGLTVGYLRGQKVPQGFQQRKEGLCFQQGDTTLIFAWPGKGLTSWFW